MVNLVEAIKRLIWIIDQTNKRLDKLQATLDKEEIDGRVHQVRHQG